MKYLTPREQEIMRILWNQGNDMAEIELKTYLYTRTDKEYARTTLATFLMKIEQKGYISKYRKGRNSYVHAEITADEFLQNELQTLLVQYCKGDKEHFSELVRGVLAE